MPPVVEALDPFGTIQSAIQRMLDVAVPSFQAFGQTLVLDIIAVMIIWFLVGLMFGRHAHTRTIDFIEMMARMLGAWLVVRYYRDPIPGFDYSLIGMIDGQFHSWMVTLGSSTVEGAYKNIDLLWGRFVAPDGGLFALIPNLLYWVGLMVVVAAKVATIYALSYGLIGQGLVRIFGPVFLPFLMVPRLNRLSWNWIWTYLNYAFLPVVGMAYVFIGSEFVAKAISVTPAGITEFGYASYLVQAIVVLVIYITGIPLIRQVSAALMGGTHGSAGWSPFRS